MTTKVKTPAKGLKINLGDLSASTVSVLNNLNRSPGTVPKPIQIRMPVEKHSEIKAYAAERQMSITELLLEAYEEYRARHK